MSFEVPAPRRLENQIASTAWLIEDVRRQNKDFQIGVGVFPPRAVIDGTKSQYDAAKYTFTELGAKVLEGEHEVSDWAVQMVKDLPGNLVAST